MTHLAAVTECPNRDQASFHVGRGEDASTATHVADTPATSPAPCSNRDCAAPKGDAFLFEIAPGWGIGFDGLQWMLMKAQKPGPKKSPWRPVIFIATERRILERVIRDKGIVMTAEGRDRLDTLPGGFRDFKAAGFTLSTTKEPHP